MGESVNKLGKTMLLVSIASFITLLFSFFRETVMASYYGSTAITDAYNIAIQLPVILFSTLAAAISKVVIPFYAKKNASNGIEAANRYTSNFITIYTSICVFIVVLCIVFSEIIIRITAPGLSQDQVLLASNIFRIVVPTVVFTGIIKVNNGVMNYHAQFQAPVLTVNCMSITFVMFVILLSPKYGIYAAVYGTLIGTIIEFIVSCLFRRKNMKYRPIFDPKDRELIGSMKMSIPIFIGIGVDELGKIFDKLISSFLDAGSISSLNYAGKLSTAVSSLLLTGITTVSYPEFTKSAAVNDEEKLGTVYNYSLNMYLLILLPVIAGGVYLNKEIIMVVFCRGQFVMKDVLNTAPLFACYLVSLLFSSIRQLSSNFFYSYGDTKTPMVNSSIGILINIILSFLLSRICGAFGIALATALSTMLVTIILCNKARNKNAHISFGQSLVELCKMSIASFLMIAILYFLKHWILVLGLYDISSTANNIMFIIISLFVGSVTYFTILLLLRSKVAIAFKRTIVTKINKVNKKRC